jgi:hypothetical protein
VRRPQLAGAGSGGNDLDVALLQDTSDAADALEFDATDTSDEKCGGGGSNADVALQAQSEQLRLERISARCALLVLSGRPVDAVLLRLRMADEEHDSSQEEAAILLAAAIVRENERSVLAAAAAAAASSSAHPHAVLPQEDLAALERRLAPTFAVRDELFHHLFTHWLERQLTLQFEAQQAQASAPLDPHSLHASLSLSSLPRLDPRIAALMSPNFGAHAYLALLQEQKRAFVQKHIWQQMDNDAAAAAARRRKERDEDVAVPPTSTVAVQRPQALAPVVSQQLWPVLSPLLLPSPGSIQHQQQALLQQNRETLDVDLPMSCLLPELHAFAAREA